MSNGDKIDQIAQLVGISEAGDTSTPGLRPTGADTTDTTLPEPAQPERPTPADTVATIGELLELEGDEGDERTAPEPEPDAPGAKLDLDELTPTSLAGALGLEPDAFYDKMTITLGDGATASLSELKDIAQGAADGAQAFEIAQAGIDAQALEMQRERHVHQLGIETIEQYFGPQAVGKLTTEVDAQAARERQRLSAMVPELGTKAGRSAFRSGAIKVLREHGFSSDNEALVALGSVKDHRLGAALHTMIKKAASYDAAIARAAETRRENGKAGTVGRSARKGTAKPSPLGDARKLAQGGRRGDKIAGVARILQG